MPRRLKVFAVLFLVMLTISGFSGCRTIPPVGAIPPHADTVTGVWTGWLPTGAMCRLELRPDGTGAGAMALPADGKIVDLNLQWWALEADRIDIMMRPWSPAQNRPVPHLLRGVVENETLQLRLFIDENSAGRTTLHREAQVLRDLVNLEAFMNSSDQP